MEEVSPRMDYLNQIVHIFGKFKELSFISWITAFFIGLATSYNSLIGYSSNNNDAINFIAFLVICDFVTRLMAQLVKANKTFPQKDKELVPISFLRLVWYAHKTKIVSSHAFFRGFFIKVVAYTCLLGIAHFAGNIQNIPLVGSISAIIYGGLIIYDLISVLENLSEAGFTQALGLLSIFKKKAKDFEEQGIQEIINTTEQSVLPMSDTTNNKTSEETLIPKSNY